MSELRWILLVAGLMLIAGIYAWGVRSRRGSRALQTDRARRLEPLQPPAPPPPARLEPEVGFAAESLCREVFVGDLNEDMADEKLMIASYFGGLSIAYSQVGVCHALSYGLSYVLGARYGVGNCVIFNHLDEYYPVEVREFRTMVAKHSISLPREMTKGLDDHQMSEMIRVALRLDPLWQNALGPDWKKIMTPEKARELYLRL